MNDSQHIMIQPKGLFAVFSPAKYLVMAILIVVLAYFIRPYFPSEYVAYISMAIVVILILAYILKYLYIKSITYTITDEQIHFKRGLFTITTDYIELYRVQDFTVVRSFLLRFIGGMSFRMDTMDKSHPVFELKGIPKSDIDMYIRNLVERERMRKRVFIAE